MTAVIAAPAGPASGARHWLTNVPGRRARGWHRPASVLSDAELSRLSRRFEAASADEIVAWAADTFGAQLCVAASMTDAVLIALASRVAPGIEVAFVDTGYHFPETLTTANRVADRYPIKLKIISAERPRDDLFRTDADACCKARKVVPLDRFLQGRSAWMSGLRRVETPDRADAPIVSRDKRGLVKVNPIARWTDAEVDAFLLEHDIVVNPLLSMGYPSIGCAPCTSKVAPGDDPRAGRWAGSGKTECGLHL